MQTMRREKAGWEWTKVGALVRGAYYVLRVVYLGYA
jgi:hypothetical protein